jgi:hypothetical protein
MSAVWKKCGKCTTENPEEMVFCVKCGDRLPARGDEKLAWLATKDIPPNPSSEEIDFDKDGRTFVVVLLIKMKESWYKLTREERVKIDREHMAALAKYAALVNRSMLRCEGISKYDYVEMIEADDLKLINSLLRSVKDGRKGVYLDIVESIVTLKGLSLYNVQASDCAPNCGTGGTK